MPEINIYPKTHQIGWRLDRLVSEEVENLTRSSLKSRGIKIFVNDQEEKLSYKVKEKDKIFLFVPEPQVPEIIPQKEVKFDLIYVDEDLAVINKPAGLTVHPAHGHEDGTLVNGLLYRLKGKLSSVGGVERPGIVHRLDKDTAGLMIVALTDRAHRKLTEDFKNRRIQKNYQAVVKGNPPESGRIEEPIGRSRKDRKKMAVVPNGKASITEYRVMLQLQHHALLDIRLLTGRTHQIRVHLAHIGYPVAGDPLYSRHPGKYSLKGIALCASSLSFAHPVNGKKMNFQIDLPEDIQALITRFK